MGAEFSAAAAAAGADCSVEEVEQRCDSLARQGRLLRSSGAVEYPDRTLSARYRFIHDLYQEVLYERIRWRNYAVRLPPAMPSRPAPW